MGAPPEITCTVDSVGDGLDGLDAALYAVSTRAAERVGHPLEKKICSCNIKMQPADVCFGVFN